MTTRASSRRPRYRLYIRRVGRAPEKGRFGEDYATGEMVAEVAASEGRKLFDSVLLPQFFDTASEFRSDGEKLRIVSQAEKRADLGPSHAIDHWKN